MQNRLFGIENEYALVGNTDAYTVDEVLTGLAESLLDYYFVGAGTGRYWLSNGGAAYRDIGEHPEYASAECGSFYDLVCAERAGDNILISLVEDYAARHPEDDIRLMKSNFSRPNPSEMPLALENLANHDAYEGEVSWGCHESYLTRRRAGWNRIKIALMPFLATRQIFTGSGHIRGDEPAYLLSGRAFYVLDVLGPENAAKQIIISRQDSFSISRKWRRIQVTCGESNMLEFPLWLKVATTHLCLRLIEEQPDFRHPNFFDDATLLEVFEGVSRFSGNLSWAVGVQRHYLDRAKNLTPINAEEKQALALWEWILNKLDCDLTRDENLFELFGVLDWATKLWFVQQEMRKRNLEIRSKPIRYLNFRYHFLTGDSKESVWLKLLEYDRRSGALKHMVSEKDIKKAETEPSSSRGRMRSEFLGLFADLKRTHKDQLHLKEINWGYCQPIYNGKVFHIGFGYYDPFEKRSYSFDQFKKEAAKWFKSEENRTVSK